MKKRIKGLCIIIIICIAVTAMFSACGLDSNILDFKDYDEFKESVKNYSMTVNNNGQITTVKVCENGYLYDNGTSIYHYNAQQKKGYLLNKANNTGKFNTYENGADLYNWESQGGIVDLLYSFQYATLLMKKDGTEKVGGRDCTIYSLDADGVNSKYWLDDEYGMCLKIETTIGEDTETMEVTEFSIGGVTLENMIDLSEFSTSEGEIISSGSPVVQSMYNFCSDVVFNFNLSEDGFIKNLETAVIANNLVSEETYILEYYHDSVEFKMDVGDLSAPILLNDAARQIDAYIEGTFDTTEFIAGAVTKTPSCTQTAEGYTVKYAQYKNSSRYWFETEIKYDQQTGSLQAQINSGTGELQEIKYLIEYNKNTNGNYACIIHYPDEADYTEDETSPNYTTLKLYFNKTSGKVSINRLQNAELDQSNLLYKKADNAAYANDGDAVLRLFDGEVSCPVNNLKSDFYYDFNNFITMLNENRSNIIDSESEDEDIISFGKYTKLFINMNVYMGSKGKILTELIKSYDNKKLIEQEEDITINISRSGDTYTVNYSEDYGNLIVTVKCNKGNSFYIETQLDGIFQRRYQWVKINDANFLEVFTDGQQYKYAFDTDTMQFVYEQDLSEDIELDIYKATNLDISTFAQPNTGSQYYNLYTYQDGALVGEYNNGED